VAAHSAPPPQSVNPGRQLPWRFANRLAAPPKWRFPMTFIVDRLATSWLTRKDLDYHIVRASMVIIFLFFGYQKWFEYEAKVLIPYISNGPLIFWLYPVFGIRGASWFLGVSEWLAFLGLSAPPPHS
jgi:hypothetical protein